MTGNLVQMFFRRLRWKNSVSLSLIFSVFLSVLFFGLIWNRTIVFADEGTILQAAWRFSQGELPYRDFHYLYTPLSLWMLGSAFSLVGATFLTSRILVLFVHAIVLGLMISTHRKIPSERLSLSWLLYMGWIGGNFLFIWPSVLCVQIAVLAFWSFCREKWVVLGVSIGAIVLTKPNLGFAASVWLLLYLYGGKELTPQKRFLIFCSWLAVIALGFSWMFYYGLLQPYADQIYNYFWLTRIGVTSSVPAFLLYGSWWYRVLKALVYCFPCLLSLVLFMYNRTEKRWIALLSAVLCAGAVYPIWDFPHYVPTLFLSLWCAVILLDSPLSPTRQRFFTFLLLVTALVGVFLPTFRSYYRWEAPLIHSRQKVPLTHASLSVSRLSAARIEWVERQLGELSPNEPVFFYAYLPGFNFLFKRENPTSFLDLTPNLLSSAYQQQAKAELEQKPPRIIVSDRAISAEENKELSAFILATYELQETYEGLYLYVIKQE